MTTQTVRSDDNIIEVRNIKKYFPVKRELLDIVAARLQMLNKSGRDLRPTGLSFLVTGTILLILRIFLGVELSLFDVIPVVLILGIIQLLIGTIMLIASSGSQYKANMSLVKEDGETPNIEHPLADVHVRAVDGVTFEIKRGEVFGLIGESGSGKTTTGRLAVGLAHLTEGEVYFNGTPLHTLGTEEMRKMRRHMQVIFQDPMASLNPRMTLGENIGHGLKIHKLVSNEDEYRARVIEILDKVGLTPGAAYIDRFPHQISGGQRQRAVIARALIMQPELILADEPIAMADVSVRAVLLDLMKNLKDEFGLTYLFITHDLATAKYICDRVAIMYLGEIVEIGDLHTVYSVPTHPYTQALMAAIPSTDPRARREHEIPRGEIPNPINPPSGCRFHPRCPIAQDVCRQSRPKLRQVMDAHEGHVAACHLRTGDYQHLDPTRNS